MNMKLKREREFLRTGVMAALETQQRAIKQRTLTNTLLHGMAAVQPKTPPPGTPTTEELMTPPPPAPEIERPKHAPATVVPLHEEEDVSVAVPDKAPTMQVEKTQHTKAAGPTVRRRAILGMNAAELRRAIIFSELIAPPKGRR